MRFVAGLNKCVFFDHSEDIDDILRIQCLFEAQAKKIGNSLFNKDKDVTFDELSPSSLDWFALGYCIANSANNIHWDVLTIDGDVSMDSFISGLKTNDSCGNVLVNNLHLYHCHVRHELFSLIKVRSLHLNEIYSTELILFLELIPPHLNDLGIICSYSDLYDYAFESLNTLCIITDEPLSDDFFGALKKLIDTGKISKVFYRCV